MSTINLYHDSPDNILLRAAFIPQIRSVVPRFGVHPRDMISTEYDVTNRRVAVHVRFEERVVTGWIDEHVMFGHVTVPSRILEHLLVLA